MTSKHTFKYSFRKVTIPSEHQESIYPSNAWTPRPLTRNFVVGWRTDIQKRKETFQALERDIVPDQTHRHRKYEDLR